MCHNYLLKYIFYLLDYIFLKIYLQYLQAHVSDPEDQDLWSGGGCGVQRGPGDQECRLQEIQIRLPEVGCVQCFL